MAGIIEVPETVLWPQDRAEGLCGGAARSCMFNLAEFAYSYCFDVRSPFRADLQPGHVFSGYPQALSRSL